LYKSGMKVSGGLGERGQEVENSPHEFEDEKLVALAQRGEQWPVDELVRRYQGKTYAIAYSLCAGDPEEARDLTQEAFLRAFWKLKRFRGDSTFYTWFYRVVVNTCLDGRRRRRRREKFVSLWKSGVGDLDEPDPLSEGFPDPSGDTNPLEALSGKRLSREIRDTLMSLPDRQRVAFKLKVLHGMSIKEIAEVMGLAEGTIKSHLFRATRCLQQALKDWV
jgi:RNA polymerase sigma-70 factor (ECF subfamily)